MSTRTVVLLALVSALVGAVVTGLVIDRRRAREAVRLAGEVAEFQHRADSLTLVQAAAVAQAVELQQRAEVQRARADSIQGRARALGHRTEALEAAVAGAVTMRDSVERLVTLAEGLRVERDEWRSTAEELRTGWDLERQATARLTAALVVSDSVRAAERVQRDALQRLVVEVRSAKRGKWLGLFPEPSRGLVFLAGGLVGAYVASQ